MKKRRSRRFCPRLRFWRRCPKSIPKVRRPRSGWHEPYSQDHRRVLGESERGVRGCPEQHLCPAGRACERLCHAGSLRRMLGEGTGKIPTLEETSCGAQECCRTGLACLPELRQADGYVPATGDSGRGEVSALLLPCLLQPELQSEDAGA